MIGWGFWVLLWVAATPFWTGVVVVDQSGWCWPSRGTPPNAQGPPSDSAYPPLVLILIVPTRTPGTNAESRAYVAVPLDVIRIYVRGYVTNNGGGRGRPNGSGGDTEKGFLNTLHRVSLNFPMPTAFVFIGCIGQKLQSPHAAWGPCRTLSSARRTSTRWPSNGPPAFDRKIWAAESRRQTDPGPARFQLATGSDTARPYPSAVMMKMISQS